MSRGTDYYIENIREGMVQVLRSKLLKVPLDGEGNPPEGYSADGYLRMIKGYVGDLSLGGLQKAIAAEARNYPLVLVFYINGNDSVPEWETALPGEAKTMRRDCRFGAACCSNNARGSEERGADVIRMVGDVVRVLGNRMFARQEGDEKVNLTLEPVTPAGDRPLLLPGVTALIQHFDVPFHYDLEDHRESGEVIVVTDINLRLDVLNLDVDSPGGVPGAHFV